MSGPPNRDPPPLAEQFNPRRKAYSGMKNDSDLCFKKIQITPLNPTTLPEGSHAPDEPAGSVTSQKRHLHQIADDDGFGTRTAERRNRLVGLVGSGEAPERPQRWTT